MCRSVLFILVILVAGVVFVGCDSSFPINNSSEDQYGSNSKSSRKTSSLDVPAIDLGPLHNHYLKVADLEMAKNFENNYKHYRGTLPVEFEWMKEFVFNPALQEAYSQCLKDLRLNGYPADFRDLSLLNNLNFTKADVQTYYDDKYNENLISDDEYEYIQNLLNILDESRFTFNEFFYELRILTQAMEGQNFDETSSSCIHSYSIVNASTKYVENGGFTNLWNKYEDITGQDIGGTINSDGFSWERTLLFDWVGSFGGIGVAFICSGIDILMQDMEMESSGSW